MRHVSFHWKENKRWSSEEVQDERIEFFQFFFASHKESCRNDQNKKQKEYDKNDNILFPFLFTDSYMTFNINIV